jgi:hypothetical protein
MFPLRLAYSMTVHKCQGKTISDKVIFDMSVPDFAAGMTFVVLSRVTKMQNLQLTPFSKDRVLNIKLDPSKRNLLIDLIHLKTITLNVWQTASFLLEDDDIQDFTSILEQKIWELKISLQQIDSGSNVPARPGPSSRGRNRRVPSRFRTGDFIVRCCISIPSYCYNC